MEYSTGLFSDKDEFIQPGLLPTLLALTSSTVMAILPLQIMGSNPKYTKHMLDEIVAPSKQAIELILDGTEPKAMQELHKGYTKRVNGLCDDVLYLMQDANRLTLSPYLKVDPVLEGQLTALTMTRSLETLIEHAICILQQDEETFAKGSKNCAALVATMEDNENTAATGPPQKDKNTATTKLHLAGGAAELFVAGCKVVQQRVAEHRAALDGVKWWKGFVGKYWD